MSLYELTDGQEMNRMHPDTFEVPSNSDLASLRVGDFIKLGFEHGDDPGERMWVEITHIPTASVTGGIRGRLANQPVVHIHLARDMAVTFQLRHVLAIGTRATAERS